MDGACSMHETGAICTHNKYVFISHFPTLLRLSFTRVLKIAKIDY